MKSSMTTMSRFRPPSSGPSATSPVVIRTEAMSASSNTAPKNERFPSPGEAGPSGIMASERAGGAHVRPPVLRDAGVGPPRDPPLHALPLAAPNDSVVHLAHDVDVEAALRFVEAHAEKGPPDRPLTL